jgi:hypothetical protein
VLLPHRVRVVHSHGLARCSMLFSVAALARHAPGVSNFTVIRWRDQASMLRSPWLTGGAVLAGSACRRAAGSPK